MTSVSIERFDLFTQMLRMRAVEERANRLFNDNKTVGRIYPGRGQEAISVGTCHALGRDDAIAPLYRDLGAQAPGLKVALPATPHDAKGLLLAALEDPNPVVFLEQKGLYNEKGPVPEGVYSVPLGKARLARSGRNLSIITYGAMVPPSL